MNSPNDSQPDKHKRLIIIATIIMVIVPLALGTLRLLGIL